MISSTYFPGESFLHKTDPRIKTIFLAVLTSAFFLNLYILSMILLFMVVFTLSASATGLRKTLSGIKAVLPILIFVIVLTPPFYRDGRDILIFRGITLLTAGGLDQTLRLLTRFSGITLAFYLFFSTTTIEYFVLTLRWFRVPFRGALIVTIALRYIPYMIMIYGNIKDAHKLRNISGGKKNISRKIKNIFPVLVSVLIHAIKSIPALSLALELKGIGRNQERSQYSVIEQNRIMIQIGISILFASAVAVGVLFINGV